MDFLIASLADETLLNLGENVSRSVVAIGEVIVGDPTSLGPSICKTE